MGWGTNFKTNIYLNKITFESYEHLVSRISELKEDILETKKSIYMYSVSNPSEIVPDEHKDNKIMFIKTELNYLLSSYEEDLNELQLLKIFKKYLDDNKLDINDFNPYKNGKD